MATLHELADTRLPVVLEERKLTTSEHAVTRLLFRRHHPGVIARRLAIQIPTVRSHKRAIYHKLEVHSELEFGLDVAEALFRDYESSRVRIILSSHRRRAPSSFGRRAQ